MPETKTYTVYKFEELSDRAKEKAREWYASLAFTDSSDWDFVYEDAATIADLIGIDIRQRPVKTMGGKTVYEPSIYFSGFSSQGDGACFEGSYSYKKGALKALRAHIGGESDDDKELLRIATGLQNLQRKNFYGLTASMKHSGHYYHSGCMSVDVADRTGYSAPAEIDKKITQYMRDFADWIYSRLKAEYAYLTSDEQVEESIRANEYTFDEDGNRED